MPAAATSAGSTLEDPGATDGALRVPKGAILLKAGDTILSVSRALSGSEERRAQNVLSRWRSRPADEVVLAKLAAFGRLAGPEAGDTAFSVVKLR